jgi:hypothetical protein
MTRIETAIQLRDHALPILRQHGSYQGDSDAKFLMWAQPQQSCYQGPFGGPSSSGAGSPIGRRGYEQNIETVALQGQHIEPARVYAKG